MFIPNFESTKIELEKDRLSYIPDQIQVSLIPFMLQNILEGEKILASLSLQKPKTR